MASWAFGLTLNEASQTPLFLQITEALLDAIRRGRLAPDERLPGSRTLAATLGVHRNTVVAAYDELLAQGWLRTSPARGTFVARDLPAKPGGRAAGVAARPGFELPPKPDFPLAEEPPKKGAIVLAGGAPDLAQVPTAALARAYRRALCDPRLRLLDYGDPRGDAALRTQIAKLLQSERGIVARPEQILVLRGSQMALRLIGDVLLSPDDTVAVESFGYVPAWVALGRGALRPVPVDAEGLDVEALEALVEREPIRAVYVTPHHQYPTMVVLSAARRLALLELAKVHRIAIIEDDYDNEVHYRGRPVLPLASADRAGVVLYVGTLSKVLAPGLRLGYLVAPEPVITRLAEHRRYVDRQGDLVVEHAVAELMEDGEVQRHARRMRRMYEERREVLLDLLDRHLGGALEVAPHDGGMALWAHAPGIDVEQWSANARDRGVWFTTAKRYAFDHRARPFVRLGFAGVGARELGRAVRRMTEALP